MSVQIQAVNPLGDSHTPAPRDFSECPSDHGPEYATDGSKCNSNSYKHWQPNKQSDQHLLPSSKGGNILPGLLSSGPAATIVMNAPFTTPAPPIPCNALPPITRLDVVAVAARADPMKNMNENVIYVAWQELGLARESEYAAEEC